MNYKNTLKKLLVVLIAIFVTLAISINPSKETGLTSFYNGNSFLWVICTIFIYQILTCVLKIKDKRLIICSLILGIILSTFNIVGTSINSYMDLSGIFFSKVTLLKSMIKWVGYIILISTTIIILFNKLSIYTENNKSNETKNSKAKYEKWFTSNKRSFITCFVVIFLAWIPYLLRYYPGVLTPDSVSQVKQALGITILNGHHPIFHTMIIKVAMKIGVTIGSQNTGVLVYSLIQMTIMAAIFSFTIYYIAKKNLPIWTRILSFVFFALYPVNAIYSITMWKNVLAGGSILLFVICMVEIVTSQSGFFASKLKSTMLIVVSLLVIYTINNGIYIILLTMPFLLVISKKQLKKVIPLLIIILVIYYVINTILFSVLDIEKGSIREALSIPLQQFARVVKYKGDELLDSEIQSIYNFLPDDNIGELYNPTLSDPVKAVFDDEYFKNNKLEFLTIWIKLFFKFPGEYIESFLCNSYGYWYPEASHWAVARYVQHDSDLEIVQSPKINGNIVTTMDSLIDRRDIPIVSMLFSLGFSFWLILFSIMYCVYTRKYKLVTIYVPIIALWLTVIASPVFCEFRYLYGMIASMPILLTGPMFSIEKIRRNENG